MKRSALLILAAGLLVAADAKEDSAKGELKKLEGEYVLVSGIDNGKKLDEKILKSAHLTMAGDKHTVKVGDKTYKGTHKVDPSKSPKTIDITDTEGAFKGKTVKGIYEFDGTEFKLCYASPGKDRPTAFSAKAESGHHLHVWKRVKK